MNIYFMRHGFTDYNKQGKIQGNTDIPLNETGVEQAKERGRYFAQTGLKFDRVYSSPLIRARLTAAIAAGIELNQVMTDERLKEMGFGTAEGKTFEEIPEGVQNLFVKPELYEVPEGGESLEALKERSQNFLDSMAQMAAAEPDIENILAVTHGAALRGIINCIENKPIKDMWHRVLTNCGYLRVEYNDGRFSIAEIVGRIS